MSRGPSLLDERSNDGTAAEAAPLADGSARHGERGRCEPRHRHPAGDALAAARRGRALALPRSSVDARLARHRRPLQADVPRDRVGAPRARSSRRPSTSSSSGSSRTSPTAASPYPSLVVAGVLPMQYFASALTLSSMSLLSNLQLVTKVYFPRTLLPLAAVVVPLVDLVDRPARAARAHVVLRHVARRGRGGARAALHRARRACTALGGGLLLSAVNVRFRDVRYMIPVILQVLPLLSGVMFAVSDDPDEVAVDPRLQPDDRGHQRLALGCARRARAGLGTGRRRCRGRRDPLRRRARGVSQRRAPLRGHDLMPTVITAEGLAKQLLASASTRPPTGRCASRSRVPGVG